MSKTKNINEFPGVEEQEKTLWIQEEKAVEAIAVVDPKLAASVREMNRLARQLRRTLKGK